MSIQIAYKRNLKYYEKKDLNALINIDYNLIYLNYNSECTLTVPIKINQFYYHFFFTKKHYKKVINSINTGKINLKEFKKIGLFIFDLEFNLNDFEKRQSEDYKDFLIEEKKDKIRINFLNKISFDLLDPFLLFSLKNKRFLKEINAFKRIGNKKIIKEYILNIDNKKGKDNTDLNIYKSDYNKIASMFLLKVFNNKIDNSLFNDIKKEKIIKRKDNIDFVKNIKRILQKEKRYQEIIQRDKNGKYKKMIDDRINTELKIIKEEGFSKYFENFYIISKILESKNIPFHLKGSGAGSFILYLININKLNPLKYGLEFNRFLGHGKVADIDIDIPSSKRNEILSLIKSYFTSVNQDIYFILNKSSLNYNKLTPHPTGILIEKKEDIFPYIPLIKDAERKIKVSQFFDSGSEPILEKIGFLKYDLISSRILEHIYQKLNEKKVDINNFFKNWENIIRWNHQYNKELLYSSYEYFQLSSPFIKELLNGYPLKSFEDIPKIVAINRPSILRNYKKDIILKNLRLEGNNCYNDVTIRKIVKDSKTGNMMVYQDQILNLLLYVLPDVEYKELTNLIKGRSNNIDYYKREFFKRVFLLEKNKNNVESLWYNIVSFKDYGMNKSHSYSYALITYFELYVNSLK